MAGVRSFTYDVFLCFNPLDTRKRFTVRLLKNLRDRGIRTFGLPSEDEITQATVKAIEESRIAFILVSDNFAASPLCLEVLAFILDYFPRKHRLIFPIYFNASIPRHRIALQMQEKQFKDNNKEKVQKWSKALRQLAHLLDQHYVHWDGQEFQLIERIMNDISRKLNRAPLHVAHHPVGLKSPLEEVYSLLNLGSGKALAVGIYGMAGIGKTTLARALYNMIADLFEGSCFLDGVRENSNKPGGLVQLQSVLLSEIVGEQYTHLENVIQAVSKIKKRLHNKKVLLILDDVGTLDQLDALIGGLELFDQFGPGSRVIITTRDERLLEYPWGLINIYPLQKLNHRDALELLIHKVFEQGNVDPSYNEVLDQMVTYASRLPLNLELIGSYLFGKSVDEWRYVLDRFERTPHDDIQTILKASFDALEQASFDALEQAKQSVFQKIHDVFDVPNLGKAPFLFPENLIEIHNSVRFLDKLRILDDKISHRILEVFQTSQWVFQAETTWKIVGLVSSVVGLLCQALSPSFNRLIGGWNSFKLFLYVVFFLVILIVLLNAKQSSHPIEHVWIKRSICFVILMILSVYSYIYDRAVDGKPEIRSLVSNVAFALLTLSLSKLRKFGFDMGVFSYFLTCFVIQLLTINWKLIVIAIIVSCALFLMHSSSDSRGQVIPH